MEFKSALLYLEKNVESFLQKPKLEIKPEYKDKKNFQEHLTTMYKNANSTHVVKSKIIDEFFEQDNIKFLIKYLKIDNTKNKPNIINEKKFIDPFAPPINQDVLISEDFFGLGEHRLILTKFPLFKEQVLLVSRDFKSQYEHLFFENIRDIILLINSIDGCAFFNGGEKSGASQPRKHLQAFPYKSFPNKCNDFGIFNFVKNENNLEEMKFDIDLDNIHNHIGKFYQIKKLKNENIEHILFKFNEKMGKLMKDNENANITGEICFNLYKILCEFLGIYQGDKIEKDYSLLITQEFIFVVKRKEHDIYISEADKEKNQIINLNSIAFFFIIVSREPSQIEELKSINIIHDVYTKL